MEKLKTRFIIITTVVFNWLGILAVPVTMLLGLNIADYITGLIAAKYRDTTSERPVKSYKSIRGIIKKVFMYLLIWVGWIVDTMLSSTLAQIRFEFQWPPVFAIVITCWLIFNEIISLLENIDDVGTPIPPFLMPIMKMIRKQITLDREEDTNESKQ